MIIVYYAPREEKTWTVHSSCKLANTSCGLANFTPMEHILFFAIPGPKIPHSRFGAGRECGTFGQGVAKNTFPHTGPKVPISRPAPKRKYGIFGLDVRKNSIRSTGVKLVSPQLVFATLAFASGVNLYELWTVQVFFLPRCVIYYSINVCF